MPVKYGLTGQTPICKGTTEISRILHGTTLVYESWATLTAEGVPPLFTVSKCKPANLLGYKIYGNSVQDGTPSQSTPVPIESVGDKTINILDIYGRTRRTSSATTPINTSEYYVGKAYSNYYNPTRIIRAELVGDTWHIQSQVNQNPYGVGFPVEVEPSTKYYIEGTKTNGAYGVSYYDSSGTFISGVNNVSSNFTTPATCAYCFLILRPNSDDEATFKNVMLSTTNIVGTTEYIGYGYGIPLRVTGKNLVDTTNVVRSNNLTYSVSGNDLVLTPTASAVSGNYYMNMGNYANFVGKTLTFNTSMITNSSTARVQLWLSGTKAENAWTNYDTIRNKDIYANTTDGYTVTIPEGNYYQLVLRLYLYNNTNSDVVTIRNLQAEVGSTPTAWVPYLTPKTANIFLNEPLRKVGDYTDYLDFETQKVYRNVEVIDDTGTLPIDQSYQGLATTVEQSVTLPAVAINNAVNMVDVPTSVVPSNLWIKYKGKQ